MFDGLMSIFLSEKEMLVLWILFWIELIGCGRKNGFFVWFLW